MIEVNLLPGATRKKAVAAGPAFDTAAFLAKISDRLKDVYVIGGAARSVIAVVVVAIMYLTQASNRKKEEARLDKGLTDSTRNAGILAARATLIAKRDTVQRQVNLIKSIDEDRYIWPHIMTEISKALPDYTWLNSVQLAGSAVGVINVVALPPAPKVDPTVKGPPPKPLETKIPREDINFRIVGRTVDIQAVTKFMNDLAGSPFITGLSAERVDPFSEQGKDAYTFTLNMTYRRQDSTSLAVHRVPLTVAPR